MLNSTFNLQNFISGYSNKRGFLALIVLGVICFFIWGVYALMLFAGVILFLSGLNDYRKKKLIENIPTSKIRSIAMGLVEIKGKAVVCKKKFKSLITKKDCVFFKTVVQRLVRSGKHSHWSTIFTKGGMVDFYLKDDTGKVVIHPVKAEFDLKPAFKYQTGLGRGLTKNLEAFLKKNKISYKGFFGFHQTLRFIEHVLPVNGNVYVMGDAVVNPSAAKLARDASKLMIDEAAANKIFYISDKPEKKLLGALMTRSVIKLLISIVLISISSFFFYMMYF